MPLFGNYPNEFNSQTEGEDGRVPVVTPNPVSPAPPIGAPLQLSSWFGGSQAGGPKTPAAPGPDYGDLTGKAQFDFGRIPGFNAPQFAAPTQEQAQNEPGYDFRLKAGSDALERSAAAKGTLRTGGNLKSLLEYGQNFGAQEYGNVYNRALQAYDRRYQGAKDQYAPQLAEWQQKAQAETAAALLQKQLGFSLYSFNNRGGGGGGGGGVPDNEPFWTPFTQTGGVGYNP